jgi:hypothetical protein
MAVVAEGEASWDFLSMILRRENVVPGMPEEGWSETGAEPATN